MSFIWWILSAMFVHMSTMFDMILSQDSILLQTPDGSKHPSDQNWMKQRIKLQNMKPISEIIATLKDMYDVSFHYQNSTNDLIDSMAMKSIYVLNNHDILKAMNLIRMRPYLFVIILEDPYTFSDLYINFVHPGDVILYVCFNNMFYDTCKNQNEWISSLLISKSMFMKIFSIYYVKITNVNILLYGICAYCGKSSEKFHLLQNATVDAEYSDTFVDVIKNSIESRYQNFNAHMFKIAFASGEFYFQCLEAEKYRQPSGVTVTTCGKQWGPEGDVLRELAKRMNFQTEFVTGPPKGKMGDWSKTIVDVNASYADWAIGGITITSDRAEKVEFSVSLGDDPMRVLYSTPDDLFATGLDIVLAFHWLTWLALLIIIVTLSALLQLSSKISYLQSLQIHISILLEQCVEGARKLEGRLFLVSWITCCVIIGTAYKAKLSSLMVNPRHMPSVQINDLILNDYLAHLTYMDSSVSLRLLSTSPDPLLNRLSQKTRNDLDLCAAIKDTLTGKSMVIEEQLPFLVTFSKNCYPEMTRKQYTRLRLTSDILFPANHAWPFRKNVPYMGAINQNILRLFQNGIYKKWVNDYLEECGILGVAFIFLGKASTGYKVYSLKEFIGPIIAWSLGIGMSILCFIIEIIYNKCKCK